MTWSDAIRYDCYVSGEEDKMNDAKLYLHIVEGVRISCSCE